MMGTIVEYTDQKPSANRYPRRIISPSRSGPCCFSDMEELGTPQEDVRWVYQYRRCRRCGFAVRVILREIPDAALVASLREGLAHLFTRTVPE
jgi:hypothetical protein